MSNSIPFRQISDDDLHEVSAAGGRNTTTPEGQAHVAPTAAGIVPELLDTHDAAKLLGIGCRTLWRWSRSGICPPPVKIGRGLRAAVRFRRQELLEWIADSCPRCERGRQ